MEKKNFKLRQVVQLNNDLNAIQINHMKLGVTYKQGVRLSKNKLDIKIFTDEYNCQLEDILSSNTKTLKECGIDKKDLQVNTNDPKNPYSFVIVNKEEKRVVQHKGKFAIEDTEDYKNITDKTEELLNKEVEDFPQMQTLKFSEKEKENEFNLNFLPWIDTFTLFNIVKLD